MASQREIKSQGLGATKIARLGERLSGVEM
jgi:hypothetical protein